MDLDGSSRSLFEKLRRDAWGQAIHLAAADAPEIVSSWSSAHHALALLHLEPDLAIAELEALYACCQREDGLLIAERALTGDDLAARVEQIGAIFDEEGRAVLTGPPVAAYAAARLARALGERAQPLLRRATEHLDAIWGERLPPDTPLPVILHPLEAGAYGTPLFDEIIDARDVDEWSEEAGVIVRSAIACNLDPDRALRAGHPFVVEDPVFCGWMLVALEECLAAWSERPDGEAQVMKLRIRTDMIARGIAERLWSEPEELFVAVDRARQSPLRAVTLGGLVPALSRQMLQEGTTRRAVDRHLRPGTTGLWGSQGISWNPISRDSARDPALVPWRGNAVSAVNHYWAHMALLRAQRPADARIARSQLEELIEAEGLREFWDAADGAGHGAGSAGGFTWGALVLEMRAQESAGAQ